MSEHLEKIMKRLLISALMVSIMFSQTMAVVVSAETTMTNMDVVDEFAKEIGIEIKKETKETGYKSRLALLINDATVHMPTIKNDKIDRKGVPALYERGKMWGNYILASSYAFNIENVRIYSGYSRDGRLYTTGTTAGSEYIDGEWVEKANLDMKWYPTTRYFSEQHPKLKDNLDSYFGEEKLFRIASIVPNGPNGQYWFGEHDFGSMFKNGRDSLFRAISYKDSVYEALKSKTQREELAKIAVENGLIDDVTHNAAPYLALFTYYGVLHRNDDIFSYDSGSKSYLSREQADLMLGRFMSSERYFEAGKAMKGFPHYYTDAMLISGSGKKPITAKELASSITKVEFIYMITEAYFEDQVKECSDAFVIEKNGESYLEDNTFWSAKAFNDINKKDWATAEWIKSKNLYGKGQSEIGRALVKNKKIDNDLDNHIQAAYKLGILNKDSKGNANLFKNISFNEAIIMLVDVGLAQAEK